MTGIGLADELRNVMSGAVMSTTDPDYMRVRQIWNGAVKHSPSFFARCRTPADVSACVRMAQRHGLALSVRGGGHDWAGRCLCHDGLVIDLSAMRDVRIDPEACIATIGGGALARDLIAAASLHNLVAVTGSCGDVGMTGLTLGGGYGLLSSRFGLALDNLLSADIVLSDGRCVTADAHDNPDLFWALRGGGGNFGVVTSLRIRLHHQSSVLAGLILFPWEQASAALKRYASVMASAPDELGVLAGMLSTADGAPAMFLAPMWSGGIDDGMSIIQELKHVGTPTAAQIGPITYGEMLDTFDRHARSGRNYAIKTLWLGDLTPTVISGLVAAGGSRTSPFSALVLHHLHGAATRIPTTATAFAERREHYLLEIIAGWESDVDDDGDLHRQWVDRLWQSLAPNALPGGYANLLGPEDHDQIPWAHGCNAEKLRALKRQFDPNGIFSAIPLAL